MNAIRSFDAGYSVANKVSSQEDCFEIWNSIVFKASPSSVRAFVESSWKRKLKHTTVVTGPL